MHSKDDKCPNRLSRDFILVISWAKGISKEKQELKWSLENICHHEQKGLQNSWTWKLGKKFEKMWKDGANVHAPMKHEGNMTSREHRNTKYASGEGVLTLGLAYYMFTELGQASLFHVDVMVAMISLGTISVRILDNCKRKKKSIKYPFFQTIIFCQI